jgi:tRNA-specific 2-thiouridylase
VSIKFSALRHRVHGLDADYVATGHYARITFSQTAAQFELRKARDRLKDQSYVLYVLTQQMLARTLLPLGDMTKADVRAAAAQLGLPVAQKPESQDICFVPHGNYGHFLEQQYPGCAQPGPILDQRGAVIGQHPGIVYYTVGQRRGLGITAKHPLYVTAIDADHNTIVVGSDADLYSSELVADRVNLIAHKALQQPTRLAARVRYRADEVPATAEMLPDESLRVAFDEAQRAVTPGQAVVCYDGDLVVGGGTILSTGSRQTCA